MASFKDEVGATRHSMSRNQLEKLYKDLENFISDSTIEEVESNLEALNKVKTMIADRMRGKNETIDEKYERFKEKYPEAILLFRIGGSYITINKDAEQLSKLLGITLKEILGRKVSSFPDQHLDNFLPKLIRSGFRVSIVEG